MDPSTRRRLPGRPSRSTTGVPTLVEICQAVLRVNVHALTELGDIPYELVEPVLVRCNAEQLLDLEDANPEVIDRTQALWEGLVAQAYPTAAHALRTRETPPCWRKVYLRRKQHEQEKMDRLRMRFERRQQEQQREAAERIGYLLFNDYVSSRLARHYRSKGCYTKSNISSSSPSPPHGSPRNIDASELAHSDVEPESETMPMTPTIRTRIESTRVVGKAPVIRIRRNPSLNGAGHATLGKRKADANLATHSSHKQRSSSDTHTPDKAAADFFAILAHASATQASPKTTLRPP
ncbi:RNA polymerase II transcription factor SIII subunit A-domain-containing protein [Thamnocephalis sphaerospora]|uniref:Elongin-A n=1 Tax=Thamnocephalis sphaerospora TaxID=78915 RepID=A0A4P9XUB3_9FUNG|nr:RNA polymerase II transcription factor SIII subunit A-domain-containing protein [Thamnocephalis sphaerospora]|eukprot:RKP09814.1 RNA polymerase II transcription factor SIII subunit A-domain-containing protein [Thamnocephalis sphaerospora]